MKKEDIHRTISQRILWEEKFIDTETIAKIRRIILKQLREKAKDRDKLAVRKLASLVAKEYGHKGKEIAAYLQKDPSVIARYLEEVENLKSDMEHALKMLSKTNCNKQV